MGFDTIKHFVKTVSMACFIAVAAAPAAAQTQPWTGSGGKGTSLAILAPNAVGLAESQGYLPALVQGEFVSNFSGFSAIEILDRQRLDEHYAELLSGYYNDSAGSDLGRLTPTTHICRTGRPDRHTEGVA
jgi:hypothetical protein